MTDCLDFILTNSQYPHYLGDAEGDVNLTEATPLPACITYRTTFPKLDSLQLPDDQHLTVLALQWFHQQRERATTYSDNETVRVFRQGLKYLSTNDRERGRRWTQLAFLNIPELISSPSPHTLLVLVVTTLTYGDSSTYKQFWEVISGHTQKVLEEGHYLRRLSAAAMECFSNMEIISHKKLLSEALATVVRKNYSLGFSIHHFPKSILSPLLKGIWNLPIPGSPTGLEFQLSDTPSLEAVMEVPIPPSFSPMENISYRTSILSCWGRNLGWQSDDIHQAALKLADRVNYVNAEDSLLLRQHCLIMLSLHNKARYDLNPDAENPRFEVAIRQLRQAIDLGYKHGDISIDLQDQVQILKSWYEKIDDPRGVQWCKKNQDQYDEQLLYQLQTDVWLLRDRF